MLVSYLHMPACLPLPALQGSCVCGAVHKELSKEEDAIRYAAMGPINMLAAKNGVEAAALKAHMRTDKKAQTLVVMYRGGLAKNAITISGESTILWWVNYFVMVYSTGLNRVPAGRRGSHSTCSACSACRVVVVEK